MKSLPLNVPLIWRLLNSAEPSALIVQPEIPWE